MKTERIEWDGSNPRALAGRIRGLAPTLEDVGETVSEVIAAVRGRGDAALRELAETFGEPVPERFRVDPGALEAAPAFVAPDVRDALHAMVANVRAVAESELAAMRPAVAELADGQRVEVRSDPVAAAGVYAPGGRGAYPSSVVMCAVPAKVAGVGRLAVASPPSAGGRPSDPVLAACAIAGVDEVYAIGGAQAIAALALGTDSVPAVDVVAGPGNRFVTEAKRQLAGTVGIDGIAGPSELAVVADGSASPRLIALDVCAQAEHGEDGLLVVISPDGALLDEVARNADELALERPSVADAPLALVHTAGIEVSLSLADALAPEHLELAFVGADEMPARARVAGCVFVGPGGAAAFGDYAVGSNHVLPTGGAARFGGPLGPGAFTRRTSVVSVPEAAAEALAPHVSNLAAVEGFPVHGESAQARVSR